MIANLMMYCRPQLDEAHARLWALIRSNLSDTGIESPEHLSQDAEEFSVWKDPTLVLSQTCGMPYRLWLHGKVDLVGTPDYGLEGCPPAYYRSAIVVRRDDPRKAIGDYRDGVFAYNQTFSQSGYAAPYAHVQSKGFWFENRLHTGGHLDSAKAVAEGRADIGALDAVSWLMMVEHDAFAEGLRVLDWTAPTPGLPLITAKGGDTDAIFDAVASAIEGLSEADRTALSLRGFVRIGAEEYLAVPNPE